MKNYSFNSEQLVRLLENATDLFLKFQYQLGHEEPRARAEAIMEIIDGLDSEKQQRGCSRDDAPRSAPRAAWDNDFVYDCLAEILSTCQPIQGHEEAFNCASILGDMLYIVREALPAMEMGRKECRATSEILRALELVARRIMEWESKALGLDALTSTNIKYIGPASEITKAK